MADLKDIAGALIWISGILCLVSVLFCFIKIIIDSDDSSKYKVKIRNSLVALVLVVTVVRIVNLGQSYFDTTGMGIGKAPENAQIAKINDNVLLNDKDKDGREILFIEGVKCIVYDRNVDLYYKKVEENGETYYSFHASSMPFYYLMGFKKSGLKVDRIKQFSSSQGLLIGNGTNSKEYALRVHENRFDSNVGKDKDPIQYAYSEGNSQFSVNCGSLICWFNQEGEYVYDSDIINQYLK